MKGGGPCARYEVVVTLGGSAGLGTEYNRSKVELARWSYVICGRWLGVV